MYDVKFHQMLTEIEDAILIRNRSLNHLKEMLTRIEGDESYTEDEREKVRDDVSELYLTIQYAQSLVSNLQLMMGPVRLARHFIESTFDDETFNMLYEEWIQ